VIPDTTSPRGRYVPALRFDVLTPLYDPLVAITTRERTFKGQLLAQAQLRAGQRVLDLGCGTGTLAILAKQHEPGARVTGIDGDPAVLVRAHNKASAPGVDISLERALSDALPFRRAQFDRVLSTLFFHHLTDDQKRRTFTEIARVLAPGGELHIADWGRPTNPLMRALAGLLQLFDGVENTRANVAGELPEYMRRAGLSNVTVTGTLSTAFGTMTLYRADAP